MGAFARAGHVAFWKLQFAALLLVLAVFRASPAWPRQHDMHSMMPSKDAMASGPSAPSPAEEALKEKTRLADKHESEFNHRLAGFFLIFAGIFVLLQDRLVRLWPRARYAWPFCFLIVGLFLLVFSDTEIWPWGDQSFYHAITHSAEALQHKVFAAILLIVSFIEIQRVRGRFTAAWTAWIFPALSCAGAILLLFHEHAAGMHGPDAMALMNRIQLQHKWYSSVGFAIVVTKALSESHTNWRSLWNRAWPVLLIVLGISLTLYTE
jgi:hypothetical protein